MSARDGKEDSVAERLERREVFEVLSLRTGVEIYR